MEKGIAALQEEMAQPAFYQQSAERTGETIAKLEAMQLELDALLERWAELEG